MHSNFLKIKAGIENVVNGADDYAQFCLRLPLNTDKPFVIQQNIIFNGREQDNVIFSGFDQSMGSLRPLEYFLKEHCSIEILRPKKLETFASNIENYQGMNCYNIQGIIKKKDIPDFINILGNHQDAFPKTEFFNLNYALGYCPKIIPGSESNRRMVLAEALYGLNWTSGLDLKSYMHYPCTDISKLRPEHREESLLASITRESGIYVNPEYKS